MRGRASVPFLPPRTSSQHREPRARNGNAPRDRTARSDSSMVREHTHSFNTQPAPPPVPQPREYWFFGAQELDDNDALFLCVVCDSSPTVLRRALSAKSDALLLGLVFRSGVCAHDASSLCGSASLLGGGIRGEENVMVISVEGCLLLISQGEGVRGKGWLGYLDFNDAWTPLLASVLLEVSACCSSEYYKLHRT